MPLVLMGLALTAAGTSSIARAGDAADANQLLAAKVIESTSAEWSPLFSRSGHAYVAPRALFLEPPRRHPSRGFGYSKQAGLIVDLGEMQDVRAIFKDDADALLALIIAHEVGHHVQHLVERQSRLRPASVSERELEADCAAGWWLGRANRRNVAATGQPLFHSDSFDRQLPQLFGILAAFKQGSTASRNGDAAVSAPKRWAAFERGLENHCIAVCGPGVDPASFSSNEEKIPSTAREVRSKK